MRHIDIGGHIDIPYKKIGITGSGNATLTSRLQQISNTKSPIKAQCIAAWQHDDAMALERAMHLLLENSRVEGEWFLDKENTLVERMKPMMALLNAKKIKIEGAEDSYTLNALKKENDSKSESNQLLLGKVSELLIESLKATLRQGGPTFFSEKRNLTYYICYRVSGKHNLEVGRSNKVYEKLKIFLEEKGFDVILHPRGYAVLTGLEIERLADAINVVEAGFDINSM